MEATPVEAAATIRRYLDTGKLYWDADGDDEEPSAIIRSRQLPTKNSVLIGADGKQLAYGDTNVVAVLNTFTGVVRAWKPFGNKRFRHEFAISAAADLPQLEGYTPWELAPLDDLKAILASGKDDVFDIEQYPDILDDWYWAQDTYEPSPSDFAWGVLFGNGGVLCSNRSNLLRALAVCRPVPVSQQ
jgi:hypothetical protein